MTKMKRKGQEKGEKDKDAERRTGRRGIWTEGRREEQREEIRTV